MVDLRLCCMCARGDAQCGVQNLPPRQTNPYRHILTHKSYRNHTTNEQLLLSHAHNRSNRTRAMSRQFRKKEEREYLRGIVDKGCGSNRDRVYTRVLRVRGGVYRSTAAESPASTSLRAARLKSSLPIVPSQSPASIDVNT